MITLNEIELHEIDSIVNSYRSAGYELNALEESLAALDKRKDEVIKTIASIREREAKLNSDLEKAYGKGKLDPLTFKYYVHENSNVGPVMDH